MANMRTFRHKITGRVAQFPDTQYWRDHPHLEIVDGPDECEDCVIIVPAMESLIIVDIDKQEETEDE